MFSFCLDTGAFLEKKYFESVLLLLKGAKFKTLTIILIWTAINLAIKSLLASQMRILGNNLQDCQTIKAHLLHQTNS